MTPVRWIIRREVRSRMVDKGFRVSMVISLLAIVAIAVLPKVLGGEPSRWEVGAVGDDNAAVVDSAVALAPAERDATAVRLDTDDAARQAVEDGDVDVVVLADGSLLADSELDTDLEGLLRQAVTTEALAGELEAQGVPPAVIDDLTSSSLGKLALLEPPDEDRDRRMGFATVGVILMFTQLIGYCYWVAMGVVEEKSSRVIEVVLAKVRPRDLLAGKVLGIGGLGLAQLVLFVAVGLGAFSLANRFPIPSGVWPVTAAIVVAFVLGYLLYASLFSIAGAMAARVEDLQATSTPFSLLVTGNYLAAMATLGDPAGSLARVLSFVPFSSPMVMPLRIAYGDAAVWEVAVAAAALVAMSVVLVRIAERVYRGGVLRTQRTTGFTELFRLAR